MKRNLLFLLTISLSMVTQIAILSCNKDNDMEPNDGNSIINGGDSNQQDQEIVVTVDANGNACEGHSFMRIDDTNFYIDDLKYTASDGNLIVSGYDPVFFTGTAKIISKLIYNGRTINVISIGNEAFKNCTIITSALIGKGVAKIGHSAFSGCIGLTSITMLESVKSIGNNSFAGCTGLKSLTIPNSVTNIGYNAFEGCSGIESISIPNSVISIGDKAFLDCSRLISVSIGDGVTEIGNLAFSGCYSLKSISLGKSLASIGYDVFNNCNYLESIVVTNGNTKYDSRENCNAIIETASNTLILGFKNTTIPNGVIKKKKKAFYNCRGLTFIAIPNSVTSIGKYAFYGCTALTSVNIPDGVTSINANAFDACNKITTVYIGNGVSFIDLSAFLGCSNLSDIYCYATTPPLHVYSTKYWSKIGTVTLHVPEESLDAYNKFPWELFRKIVAI